MPGGRTGAHFVIGPSQKGSPGSWAAVNLVDLQMLIASNQLLTWGRWLGFVTKQSLTDIPSPSRRMYWEWQVQCGWNMVGCRKVGMRPTRQGSLFFTHVRNTEAQGGQACVQGHTASQHRQGSEPGFPYCAHRSHGRKRGLKVLLQSLY